MNIAVIGTGYVGLVVGTCFAETGNSVTCVDKDEAKISRLHEGQIPIYEPGLEEMVRRNVEHERLKFSTDLPAAVKDSTILFVAVGTPQGEDGSADLSHVLAVAGEIGQAMNGYKVIVDKSTVPVGTARRVAEAIRAETKEPFDVVSNPEFLKEGAAVDDFLYPDRVVIGAEDPRVVEIMRELYLPFVRTGNPILFMDIASAELTKYTANAMLATRISFMNEVANLCERVGADVNRVREGVGLDKRIGHSFLFPGPGYGGSCFPKDVRALIKTSREHGYSFQILECVDEVNLRQKKFLVEKIRRHYHGNLKGKKFGVWGLAFKPRTDDMREAPSITIIEALLADGASVHACDPEAIETARAVFGDRIAYTRNPYDAIEGADALVIVTDWSEFRHPDFEAVRKRLGEPVIFDGRNLYNVGQLRDMGFSYHGIGIAGA